MEYFKIVWINLRCTLEWHDQIHVHVHVSAWYIHCIFYRAFDCTYTCVQVVSDEATTVVSMFNFDVLGSHSSWQCVELLLTHLPLLRLLLSILLGSYKRVGYVHVHIPVSLGFFYEISRAVFIGMSWVVR